VTILFLTDIHRLLFSLCTPSIAPRSLQHLAKGRVNRTKLDVGVHDGCIRTLTLDVSRNTRCSLALSATASEICVGVLIGGVGRVKPEHVGVVVVPERHDEHHALCKSLGHVSRSALLLVCVPVLEDVLLLVAELGGDRIARNTSDSGVGLSNGLAALDVEAFDFHGIASADELCDHGELLRCVNCLALAVEVLDTHAVAVEVAAVGVADASIAVSGVGSTTIVTLAARLLDCTAGVGSHRRANGVGLPDVHLCAA
jgi:hypothetical protein